MNTERDGEKSVETEKARKRLGGGGGVGEWG